MIFSKSYSLLLVPHDGTHGKATFLHLRLLNVSLVVLAAGLLTAAFFTVRHFAYHHRLKTQFEPTFAENQRLRYERDNYSRILDSLKNGIVNLEGKLQRERGDYVASVGRLAGEIDALRQLAVKVKIQAGFKTSSVVDEGEPAGGPDAYKTDIGRYDLENPIDPARLEGRLRPGIADQRAFLEGIDGYLGTKKSLVAATPEMAPLFGKMTSGFGTRRWKRSGHVEGHGGLDIAVDKGTPVSAPAEGVVIYCAWQGDYGNLIEIDHGTGYTTRYGHLSKFNVEIGDRVTKGQVIGFVGSTGRSTGPHLHYEVRLNGNQVDPIQYMGSNIKNEE